MKGKPGVRRRSSDPNAKPSVGKVTHRMRRGKLVEIPEEWRGHVPHPQTIRKRLSISRRTRKENK